MAAEGTSEAAVVVEMKEAVPAKSTSSQGSQASSIRSSLRSLPFVSKVNAMLADPRVKDAELRRSAAETPRSGHRAHGRARGRPTLYVEQVENKSAQGVSGLLSAESVCGYWVSRQTFQFREGGLRKTPQ